VDSLSLSKAHHRCRCPLPRRNTARRSWYLAVGSRDALGLCRRCLRGVEQPAGPCAPRPAAGYTAKACRCGSICRLLRPRTAHQPGRATAQSTACPYWQHIGASRAGRLAEVRCGCPAEMPGSDHGLSPRQLDRTICRVRAMSLVAGTASPMRLKPRPACHLHTTLVFRPCAMAAREGHPGCEPV
jgi:hypothetical protein